MNYSTLITRLYFLLIHADGNVNARELATARQMTRSEGISEADFSSNLEKLKSADPAQLLNDCLIHMRKIERSQQIRIVAWLCVLANADGFMDRAEWQMIYRIYHKELDLPLGEIFAVQKELNKLVWLPNPAMGS